MAGPTADMATALMSSNDMAAFQLATRLLANGNAHFTAAAVLRHSGATHMRRAIEYLLTIHPTLSDADVQLFNIVLCNDAAANQRIRHNQTVIVENARKVEMCAVRYTLDELCDFETRIPELPNLSAFRYTLPQNDATALIRAFFVGDNNNINCGANGWKTRTLLAAQAVGLLHDDAFLSHGLVTCEVADALKRTFKDYHRAKCKLAIQTWATSIDQTVASQALLQLSDDVYDELPDVDDQLSEPTGGLSTGTATTPPATTSLLLSGPPPPVSQEFGLAIPTGPEQIATEWELDVSTWYVAAEAIVEQILLHLWRTIDLNQNEQCGKQVQVLYRGDNEW